MSESIFGALLFGSMLFGAVCVGAMIGGYLGCVAFFLEREMKTKQPLKVHPEPRPSGEGWSSYC